MSCSPDDTRAAFIDIISDLSSRGYAILHAVIDGALHHVAIRKGEDGEVQRVALLEETLSIAKARARYQADFTIALVRDDTIIYMPDLV